MRHLRLHRTAAPLVAPLVATFVALSGLAGPAFAGPPRVRVVDGWTAEGTATELWRAVLLRRRPAEAGELAALVRPPTAAERAWAARVRERAPAWEGMIPALAEPFAPLPPPAVATVVLGDRGGEDAFTHDPTTIGFDLGALQANYGDAGTPENGERLDRFFRHEYMHLLQKAWFAEHPFPMPTPLAAAQVEMWTEGMGNFFSLSDRWRSADGAPSPTAAEALARLEPRLAARLAALACAPPERAAALTADLSNGRFDRKWGALPVALWLEAEVHRDGPAALRAFAQAGPEAVWTLAERRLPAALWAVVREVRAAAETCGRAQVDR